MENPYDNPVWLMYECENGARWTAVKGGMCMSGLYDFCDFSGCPEKDHRILIKGETSDRDKAHNWFRRPGQK